jgi:glycosyltransferase involved in cell wall biosynthesis
VHTAVEALGLLRRAGVAAVLTNQGWADSEYQIELRRLAASSNVSDLIEWRESGQPEQVPGLLAQSDILVFPTLWDEPFGLVPLEAMAMGCVVVATGTGGSGEFLIDDVSTLRFGPGDATGLANAISQLSDDSDLLQRLRGGGLATAADHDVNRFHQALDSVSRSIPG